MREFIDLNFKEHYDSQKDDLIKDFYVPALANTKKYFRVVGYFNSKTLSLVAIGLKDFILNNGKMDLICGVDLNPSDINMVRFASEHPEEILNSSFLKELDSIEDEITKHHVEVLGWMIANGLLRIRVAVKLDDTGVPKSKEAGILHYKIGIMKDYKGNILSFSGSVNETAKAWKDNLEEFHLFRSWYGGELTHLKENLDTFYDLWNSKRNSYKILDIPAAVEQRLIEVAPKDFDKLVFHDNFDFEFTKKDANNDNDDTIELYEYQEEARENWLKEKKGIFVMATGTGKTYTALGCLEKIIEEEGQLATIISVPQKHLIPQWMNSIKNYGLKYDKLVIATGDTKWRSSIENDLLDIRLKNINKLIILTTHDTLPRPDFLKIMSSNHKFKYFIIGDEMHGLGSNYRKGGLKEELYDYRLGLSATPTRYSDEETEFLLNYFGDVVKEITLRQAIYELYSPKTNQSYLTPYYYYPYFLNLNHQELEEYKDLTLRLFRCSQDEEYTKRKEHLLFERANIIKNANGKYELLDEILDNMDDFHGLIVYCSSDQKERVLKILSKRGIISHQFTMDEDPVPRSKYGGLSQRESILDDFAKGNYEALVAMHCLDEGVDVPSASKAIFMCSSNSSREFIQRVGRVIRRYEGKTHADIYDLIVKPSGFEYDKSLNKFENLIFEKEMNRYKEIGYIAENYDHVLGKINENL